MHATENLDPQRRYLCRHVHTDGRRCGSPALRAQNFCYYHDRSRLPNAPLAGRIGIFRMQPIDDRAAIQIALYDILSRITAGDLDPKRASILLYGLQIASSNLARLEKAQPPTDILEHITQDHRLGDLAPIEEIPEEETQQGPPLSPEPTPSETVILSEAVREANSAVEEPDTPNPTTTARTFQPRTPTRNHQPTPHPGRCPRRDYSGVRPPVAP